jgi:hypothetical protein
MAEVRLVRSGAQENPNHEQALKPDRSRGWRAFVRLVSDAASKRARLWAAFFGVPSSGISSALRSISSLSC